LTFPWRFVTDRSLTLDPLLPPLSLFIYSFEAPGYVFFPRVCHHRSVVIVFLPTFILYILLSEKIIAGVTAGAIKG
jgi:ABC-type maltose transport system permease subunit